MTNFNLIVIRDSIGELCWEQLINCSVQTLFTQFPFLSELEHHGSHKTLRDAHNSEAIACLHRHLIVQVRPTTGSTPCPAIRFSDVHRHTWNSLSNLIVKNLLKLLLKAI